MGGMDIGSVCLHENGTMSGIEGVGAEGAGRRIEKRKRIQGGCFIVNGEW